MKMLFVAALAGSLLAGPAWAHNASGDGAFAPAGKATTTSPAKGTSIAPHAYAIGDYVSPSYGKFTEVPDWEMHHLTKPDAGSHWVLYGHNYLLVKTNDGRITKMQDVS
jgi:Ni/Co efflux regulator RcnB